MENIEDCNNCQSMREQVEQMKKKHLLDFRTIKQKIISTDELIKLYQKKCQESDKQTKCVAELTTKLVTSQRNMDVVRFQLEKSLQLNEPLKKVSSELEKEKELKRIEVQKLQDRLRASESLTNQLKDVLKQKESAAGSFMLDVSIQEHTIEEQKKSLKKNGTVINKLKEQILAEKNGKKEISKELKSLQNKYKTKEKQVVEFQEKITNLLEDLKEVKEEIKELNKRLKEQIHSPSPPKQGRTTRRTITFEQRKVAVEKPNEVRVKEIIDIIAVSPCPSLSPLPISPCPTEKDGDSSDDDDDSDFLNTECEYIDNENNDEDNDHQYDGGSKRNVNNTSKLDHDLSLSTLSDSSCSEPDISNERTKKMEKERSPESKTNSGKRRKEEKSLDNNEDVSIGQAQFVMTLRSGKKRKRKHTESEISTQISRDNDVKVGGIKAKKLFENAIDERSYEPRETKMTNNECFTELTKSASSKTNPLNPSCSFGGNTIPAACKSFADSTLKSTEEVELEVSACLRSIIEAVELQESNAVKETIHEAETRSVEEDVLDCLQSIVDRVSITVENSSISLSSDIPPMNCQDLTRDKLTVVKTKGLLDARIVDSHRNSSDTPRHKTVQSSILICDKSRRNVKKDCPYSKGLSNGMPSGRNKTEELDSCFDTMKSSPGRTDKQRTANSILNDSPNKAANSVSLNQKKVKVISCINPGGRNEKRAEIASNKDDEILSSSMSFNKEKTTDSKSNSRPNQGEMFEKVDNTPESSTESPLNDSSTFSPDLYAPLSPIPCSPERTIEYTEMPSFDVLDIFPPLSPLPPSPKGLSSSMEPENDDSVLITDESEPKEHAEMIPPASAIIKSPEQAKTSSSVATLAHQSPLHETNVVEKIVEGEPPKKKKTPVTDRLNRDPRINEHGYVLRLLSQIKKGEITTEVATKRFSIITNLRASSPFLSALLQMLKNTPEHEENELVKKCTQQWESVRNQTSGEQTSGDQMSGDQTSVEQTSGDQMSGDQMSRDQMSGDQTSRDEKAWTPIITAFEMHVAVVVRELSKLEQFCGLIGCLLRMLGKTMFSFFRSGGDSVVVLALCRVYTTVCRLMGDGGRVRLLCYDIIKENQRHLLTNDIIMSVGLVWPAVLRKDEPGASPLAGKLTNHVAPFLSTLQVITRSRETSSKFEQSTLVFQRLCGWSGMPCEKEALELQAFELVRLLREAREVGTQNTKSDFGPSMGDETFEAVKSLELLAVVLGWEWTNDVLIRDQLWPVLEEWKRNGLSGSGTEVVHGSHTEPNASDCINKVGLASEILDQKSEIFGSRPQMETMEVKGSSTNGDLKEVEMDMKTNVCLRDLDVETNSQTVHMSGDLKEVEMDVKTNVCLRDLDVETNSQTGHMSGDLKEVEMDVKTNVCHRDLDVETNSQTVHMSIEISDCMNESNTNASCFDSNVKLRTTLKDTDINEGSNNGVVVAANDLQAVDVDSKMKERVGFQTTDVKVDDERKFKVKKQCNMERTVVSVLRLLGLLGLLGLHQDEVNLDAVVNLMCAVITCTDEFKGVTFAIKLAAAYAAVDMLTANPMRILNVLDVWTTKTKKNLPAHFTNQLKYCRAYLFGKKPS